VTAKPIPVDLPLSVFLVNNAYTCGRRKSSMPSNKNDEAARSEDDFEDISVVTNLLEVQSRLKTRTDSIESQSG